MPKERASAKVGLGRGPLLLSKIEEEHACAEERAHVPRHDMCSVAHIFERLGLIRARCECVRTKTEEGDASICHGNVCSGNGTYDTWCERERLRYPQKTQSSLRLQGQGSNRRTRTTCTGGLTSHNRAITNPKLRDILFVECVEKREGGRVGGGPYMKSERKRRGGGGGAGAQSIHVWCHKRPNPTDQGPSPRSIAVNRNSRYLRRWKSSKVWTTK